MVAFYLLVFRCHEPKRPDEWGPTIKAAKNFLKAVEHKYRQTEHLLKIATRSDVVPAKFWLQHQKEVVSRIEQIRLDIKELTLLISEEPRPDWEPIRKIASVAQEAWAETNDGCYPKSFNPDDPICRFLEHALEAIDQKCAPATISSVLRNRRRRVSGRGGHF
jgi:hypothetical protein